VNTEAPTSAYQLPSKRVDQQKMAITFLLTGGLFSSPKNLANRKAK
jgi:hypothetical protein